MNDDVNYPFAWGLIISGLLMAFVMGMVLWMA